MNPQTRDYCVVSVRDSSKSMKETSQEASTHSGKSQVAEKNHLADQVEKKDDGARTGKTTRHKISSWFGNLWILQLLFLPRSETTVVTLPPSLERKHHFPSSGDRSSYKTKSNQIALKHTQKLVMTLKTDEQGLIKESHMRAHDVWSLPRGTKLMIPFNTEHQPIGDAAGLLGSFLGELGSDFKAFPVGYNSWKDVPKTYKDGVYTTIIQNKLHVEDPMADHYILQNIGKKWKDNRHKLFHEFYDPTLSRDANIAKHPKGIDRNDWAHFIDYRLDERTKEKCKKNIEIRKKLTDPHTGGTKSNSRLKAEMEYELGRSVSRGEVYIATHTKKDGSYVTDEARQISEKILEIEKEDSTSRSISQQDSLAKVLGKEHSGRVRALGFGPCPSQVFGNTNSRFSGMMSSQPTQNTDLQVQQKIHQLESQLEIEKLKRKGYEGAFTYIFQKLDGNVPAEFARLFTTPAEDEESGQASPATARPSSPCQNTNEDLHRLHSP